MKTLAKILLAAVLMSSVAFGCGCEPEECDWKHASDTEMAEMADACGCGEISDPIKMCIGGYICPVAVLELDQEDVLCFGNLEDHAPGDKFDEDLTITRFNYNMPYAVRIEMNSKNDFQLVNKCCEDLTYSRVFYKVKLLDSAQPGVGGSLYTILRGDGNVKPANNGGTKGILWSETKDDICSNGAINENNFEARLGGTKIEFYKLLQLPQGQTIDESGLLAGCYMDKIKIEIRVCEQACEVACKDEAK